MRLYVNIRKFDGYRPEVLNSAVYCAYTRCNMNIIDVYILTMMQHILRVYVFTIGIKRRGERGLKN